MSRQLNFPVDNQLPESSVQALKVLLNPPESRWQRIRKMIYGWRANTLHYCSTAQWFRRVQRWYIDRSLKLDAHVHQIDGANCQHLRRNRQQSVFQYNGEEE